jgi:hypothetical protein
MCATPEKTGKISRKMPTAAGCQGKGRGKLTENGRTPDFLPGERRDTGTGGLQQGCNFYRAEEINTSAAGPEE